MSTPTNPALIISGPAVIVGRGTSIFTKDNIVVTPNPRTFAIETSQYGNTEEREDSIDVGFAFTPVGVLAGFGAWFPYATRNVGELAHLVEIIETVSTTGDSVEITAHRFRSGHGVRVVNHGGALPTGLSAATKYYLGYVDADNVSFHLTEAAALALTSPVNLTAAGSGTNKIIEQEELTIWSLNEGRGYTFHNHVISAQPDLNLAGAQTPFGPVGIRCFRKHAVDPTDAAALFTAITVAPTYSVYDPAAVITQPYVGDWGAVAPWVDFPTRDGFKCSFPVDFEDVPDDVGGIISLRVAGRGARVVARPRGVTDADIFTKLTLQGSGAGRGRRITGDDLDLTGTGLFVRIYAASILSAPQNFDRREDRIGDVTWRANQSFAAGVPNPLFYIGASPLT